MERSKLPFRKNCEGYFFNKDGKLLAKKSEQGFVIFPGGGIDESETVENGMIRETLEETGAVIVNLKTLGSANLVWGPNWAQTEKQKKRYEQFQGDEMHFFSGEVKEFVKHQAEEDTWGEDKFMSVAEVLHSIKERLDADRNNEYVQTQFKFLTKLKEMNKYRA